MSILAGSVLDTITAICVLVLLSLGLYVVYGLLRVINMAHGEMLTMGAYCVARLSAHGWPFLVAAAVAGLVVGVFGLLLERVVLRSLYGRHDLSTLLATWGVGLIVTETLRLVFGPSGEFVDPPTRSVVALLGVPYSLYNIYLVLAGAGLFVLLAYLLAATPLGMVIRATMENAELASLRGVDVPAVYRWGFAGGAAMTGFAGALIGPISAVTPTMGVEYATLSFLVVIVGGTSSPASTRRGRFLILGRYLAAAALVAGSRSVLNALFGITPATLGMLGVVLATLAIHPEKLLARR